MRNLARAVEGMPLIHVESDSVLGTNGKKWEAHTGATAPRYHAWVIVPIHARYTIMYQFQKLGR